MFSDSDSGDEAKSIDKRKQCAYCSENFEDVDHDNRPVINHCGCVLHWYCRYRRSGYSKDGDCRSCPGCGQPECTTCKELRRKIRELTLKVSTLEKELATQQQKQQ